jgi:prevent-host-death family protein
MKTTSALDMRQSLGKILDQLRKDGKPVLVEQRSQPAAVLISIDDYRKRFADVDADNLRKEIVARIKATRLKAKRGSLAMLQEDRQ